eukprot:1147064-Pelagomonas_calceolata.AAC.4
MEFPSKQRTSTSWGAQQCAAISSARECSLVVQWLCQINQNVVSSFLSPLNAAHIIYGTLPPASAESCLFLHEDNRPMLPFVLKGHLRARASSEDICAKIDPLTEYLYQGFWIQSLSAFAKVLGGTALWPQGVHVSKANCALHYECNHSRTWRQAGEI